jgi:hypothetical protein
VRAIRNGAFPERLGVLSGADVAFVPRTGMSPKAAGFLPLDFSRGRISNWLSP